MTLPDTRAIEINVDGLPPTTVAEVEAACADLEDLVRQFCGGRVRREVLSQVYPRMSLTT